MKKSFLLVMLSIGILGFGQTPAFKNTARDYCKGLGYKITKDPQSKEERCILPNGDQVNLWDFFHGVVGKEYSYCAKKGYTLRLKEVKNGPQVFHYPICDAPDKPSKHMLAMLDEDPDYSYLYNNPIGAPPPDTLPPPPEPIEIPDPDPGFPEHFTWKNVNNKNWVSVPKDQGAHGVCYAMASSTVAESVYNFHHNLPVTEGAKEFSPAFIAFYYNFLGNNYSIPFEWWNLRGSLGDFSGTNYDALVKLCTNGIIEESEFPWDSLISDSLRTSFFCERYRFNQFIKCDPAKTNIKTALMEYGPIYTTMSYDQDLHDDYMGEVLYGDVGCATNHAVVIVGWDYDPYYGEYWIVKNSYGPTWPGATGSGYLRVASNNALGINCNANYLIYSPVQVNGDDLAYKPQAITNVPSGHRSIQYKLEYPGSGYQWSTGSVANTAPLNDTGRDAVIKFKVNYGKLNYYLDPDSIEFYQKPVWAGRPKTPTIDGSSTVQCYVPIWYYGNATSSSGLYTADTYEWIKSSNAIQILYTYDTPPRIQIQVTSPGTHTLTLRAINDCGPTLSQVFSINCPICYTLNALLFPNPSSDQLTIQIDENNEISPEFDIELIDQNSHKWKEKKTKNLVSSFNVQGMPPGSYTANIKAKVDGQTIKEKAINFIIAR
ncbi:MAG: hypothetical protein D4R64_04100 [Porphyromonadaceae bacterium]|nr:MAG: hypothetical protein D4R64_04100 [Porphyromonadaceae bacterium]